MPIEGREKKVIGIYAKNLGGVWFGVACDAELVFGTCFASGEKEAIQSLLCGLPFNVEFQVFSEPSAFAEEVLASVKNVFEGKDVSRRFSLATEHLPAYTRRVLEAATAIPVGYVTFYSALAEAAGGGARAVGNVMASNPFAPIVPCHRVVRSDFSLGGYGGGLDTKLEFLIREKRGYQSTREVPVGGGKLKVFPVEQLLAKLKKGE